MDCCQLPISPYPVALCRDDLRNMVKLARLLHKLSESRTYQAQLADCLPTSALFDPGHHAVMMGYDFHLTASGPKLIEVNTNAGGLWLAYLCGQPKASGFAGRCANRLLAMFLTDYALFAQTAKIAKSASARPKTIAIIDQQPEGQFLYPEMHVFAALFKQAGIAAIIADPSALAATGNGLYCNGQRIDMIYNRHCDFYLTTPEMAAIRAAWLNGQVCLSPNPRSYGLLADKRRMILWSDHDTLGNLGLCRQETDLLRHSIPATELLDSLPLEEAWRTHKQWVFKPDTGYASRGVYVGNKLTSAKLAALDAHNTIIQQWVPPSVSQYPDELPFKTDFRLFAYRSQIVGIAARLYQGQVTNLRTPNGGFAKVVLE